MALSEGEAKQSDAFAERLLTSALGMMDVLAVYLGDRLGLYTALAEGVPATAPELAQRAACDERYVREWLEQQAVGGLLDASEGDATSRKYWLSAGHADALLNRDSMNYMAPLLRILAATTAPLPKLLEAYRNGGGVSWEHYGIDATEGQGEVNRPPFLHLMSTEWLPAVPDLHDRLQADPPARVADFACGVGWSSIGIAKGYPKARVDGLDLDAKAIAQAQQNAREHGVEDRVTFAVRDAADPALQGNYDLVTVFEALHDMSQPVAALRVARGLLVDGGSLLVVDERVNEEFTAPGDEIERLMYGWSILACLANGMAEQPSAATGTVMRPETLRGYARGAGFGEVEVLPIEHLFFRFYRLRK
jgi:2-polyprenyl-3-methyl-5-hydroxy-6-metoxy-1,4-benzoquinol methylase